MKTEIQTSMCGNYVDELTLGESQSYGNTGDTQKSMDSLHKWTVDKLKLNATKCQVMQVYFGRKPTLIVVACISSQKLAVVDKVKLLGVIIDKNLKWEGQVDSIYTKANRKLFMLRKLKVKLGRTRKVSLYFTKGMSAHVLSMLLHFGIMVLQQVKRLRRSRSMSAATSLLGIYNIS